MENKNWPFKDNEDGTITDLRSKLVWLKNIHCFEKVDWNKAKDIVKTIKSGQNGLSDKSIAGDWRLPTIEEFKSFSKITLCLSDKNFKSTSEWLTSKGFINICENMYWTKSTCPDDDSGVWTIDICKGKGDFTPIELRKQYSIWPVRIINDIKMVTERNPQPYNQEHKHNSINHNTSCVISDTNNVSNLNNINKYHTSKDEIIKHNEESENEFDIIHMVFKHIDICYFIFCVVLLIYAYTCGSFVFWRALVFVISSYVVFYVLCKISR